MLVSLKWLSQYVDISALSADDLAEKITRAGIEVDAVIDRSSGMDNIVIGHVVSKEKHPEADKLNVCQVDVGNEELQQISGVETITFCHKGLFICACKTYEDALKIADIAIKN